MDIGALRKSTIPQIGMSLATEFSVLSGGLGWYSYHTVAHVVAHVAYVSEH